MRRFLLMLSFTILLSCPSEAIAQSMDELMDRIKYYEERVYDSVQKFQREVDERYMQIIGKPWGISYSEELLTGPLDKDKPIIPEPFDPSRDVVDGQVRISSDVVGVSEDRKDVHKDKKKEFVAREGLDDRDVEILCNGLQIALRCPKVENLQLQGTSEKDVASAWEKLASYQFDNLLRDLSHVRDALNMSDWSLLCAVEELSKSLYGTDVSGEAVLFQAYVLNRFGFLLCLGRSEDGNLHKLLSVDKDLIGYHSYIIDGQVYYLFDKSVQGRLAVVPFSLNGESPMRMEIREDELFYPDYSNKRHFASKRYPQISVSVASDKNRITHYNRYPVYFSDKDVLTAFYYHAAVPLSQEVREAVFPVLKRELSGKSEYEAVNMILNFVQTAFIYKTDEEMWGMERYLYADELWHYDFSDCEDRSMLFSRLVRDLLGLKVALVYWPGHLSCAVRFNSSVPGAFFETDGEIYVSCDPTFIGAGVGAIMDDVKELPATLIML